MAKKGMKFSSQRSVKGISVPSVGTLWKNNVSRQEFVVMGNNPRFILIRERHDEVGEPVKLTDFVGFYREFSYVGKELA